MYQLPAKMPVVQLSGGRTAEELRPEQQEQYKKDFTATKSKVLRIQQCGTIILEGYQRIDKDMYYFKFRPDDVLVMTYPKCGTTWTQEIIWNMRNNPNLDHPNPHEALFSKSPFLDADMIFLDILDSVPFEMFFADPAFADYKKRCPNLSPDRGIHIQLAESMTENRTLKTHLPFSCFKPGLIFSCKVVFVMRHPKDVLLSYQHHCRLMKGHGFVGTQDVFTQYFVDELLLFGTYSNMVKEAMQYKSHPNLHIMYYEDMKADIGAELRRLNHFLGTKLNSKQLKNVEEHTSFSNMKKNDPMAKSSSMLNEEVAKKDGGFIRNGLAGSWKGKMTPEQEEKVDRFIARNFQDPDFKARYLQ